MFKLIKFVTKNKSELAIPSQLIWSGKIFNILFYITLIFSIIFILESVFCKIRYSKRKANREYSYTTRIVAALSWFCVCGAVAFLSATGSALNSVFMEYFYVILIIFLFWFINHKLNQNILSILYHQGEKKGCLIESGKNNEFDFKICFDFGSNLDFDQDSYYWISGFNWRFNV